MSTNLQIIDDALSELGVLGEGESANATQITTMLRVFNQMMNELREDSVNLGYFDQTASGDTCPIPAWAERGITSMLAVEVAPRMRLSPSMSLVEKANDGYSMILRNIMNNDLKSADMTHLPGSSNKRSILTDS